LPEFASIEFINRLFSLLRPRSDAPRAATSLDRPQPPRLCVVVEGRHDIEFLKRIGAVLHDDDPTVPDLARLERAGDVLFIPAGGGDFRPWLTRLACLGAAELHLYDRETSPETERRLNWVAIVNQRPRCRAFVTARRSLENYLHPAAIDDACGLKLVYSAEDDVADLAARAAFIPSTDANGWDELSRRARRRQRHRAKRWLNTTAVERMTATRLAEHGPSGEVVGWFRALREMLDGEK